jgi:hypothetical protein
MARYAPARALATAARRVGTAAARRTTVARAARPASASAMVRVRGACPSMVAAAASTVRPVLAQVSEPAAQPLATAATRRISVAQVAKLTSAPAGAAPRLSALTGDAGAMERPVLAQVSEPAAQPLATAEIRPTSVARVARRALVAAGAAPRLLVQTAAAEATAKHARDRPLGLVARRAGTAATRATFVTLAVRPALGRATAVLEPSRPTGPAGPRTARRALVPGSAPAVQVADIVVPLATTAAQGARIALGRVMVARAPSRPTGDADRPTGRRALARGSVPAVPAAVTAAAPAITVGRAARAASGRVAAARASSLPTGDAGRPTAKPALAQASALAARVAVTAARRPITAVRDGQSS